MSETKLTTEDKIREAALKIFKQKGFDGTSVQDIANEAGTTKSMVNYYFRTKEKLFSEIYLNQHKNLHEGIGTFILSLAPLKEKIEKIVAWDIDKISEIPDVPIFILTEVHHNPEIIFKNMQSMNVAIGMSILNMQIKAEAALGRIRVVEARDLILNIQALTIFPFLGKPLLMKTFSMDEKGFNEMLQQRKKEIPEIIWNWMKI